MLEPWSNVPAPVVTLDGRSMLEPWSKPATGAAACVAWERDAVDAEREPDGEGDGECDACEGGAHRAGADATVDGAGRCGHLFLLGCQSGPNHSFLGPASLMSASSARTKSAKSGRCLTARGRGG